MWIQRLGALVRAVFIPPHNQDQRNTYYLYVEIVFAALLSVAGSFNGAFILRSGGSNTLIGLLSSIPPLVATFLYLPSARILEKQSNHMRSIVGSLLISRVGYLAIPLLPLFMAHYVPEATVTILVLMTIPSVFFSTAWSPLMAEVVPLSSRATVLAWRTILMSATIAPLIYVAGRWLEFGAKFPTNYQWMYIVSFLAGAVSTYLVSRIRPLPKTSEASSPNAAEGGKAAPQENWWVMIRSTVRDNPGFGRMMLNTFVFNLAAWMVGPLYIILYVRQLGASDGWLGLNNAIAYVGVILGYWVWRRIIRHIGEGRALLFALPFTASFGLLVGLIPNLTFILILDFLVNVVAPGFDLSINVTFLELLPEGKRYSTTAIWSTVMNLGAFICPLIGVAISDRIGIIPTLIIGGVLRLAGASLYFFFPVKKVQPLPKLTPFWLQRGRMEL